MKFLLKGLGLLAAIGVSVWIVARNAGDLPLLDWSDTHLWRMLVFAVGFNLLSTAASAEGWRILIAGRGPGSDRPHAMSQFLVAQFGKYLPGNVLHLAGRVGLAARDGVPAAAAAAAVFSEFVLAMACVLVLAALGAAASPPLRDEILSRSPDVDGLIVIATVGAAAGIALLVLRRRIGPPPLPGPMAAIRFLAAQSVATLLLGASLVFVSRAIGDDRLDVISATAAFSAAWALGALTPGAPGGIGVREAALTVSLGLVIGEPAALTAALIHRAASVAADAIAFLAGLALRARLTRADRR